MTRALAAQLIWSPKHAHYELSLHGCVTSLFQREDETAFSRFLEEHSAFAFRGEAGSLSVRKETRSRKLGYWYAYRTLAGQTHKRYLGPTSTVTLVRLEETAQALAQEFVDQSKTRLASSALLASQLSPPRLPLFLVKRSRLLSELKAVPEFPLTLVSASAGSGKTTLLTAWVAALRERREQEKANREADPVIAWLSLEELDNDPIRFWGAVLATMRRGLPGLGETAYALLHAEETLPLSTCLLSLLSEIEQLGKELILILDDSHVLEEQTTTDSLRFVLDHLPANLHLVLSTRTDPALPLARLRVRAQLVEIRDQDLCFTVEEATSFLLDGMKLSLSPSEVATLHQRTEGWIAGLHLAALAMRKRTDLSSYIQNFAGTSRQLLDYVEQDILARLPASTQDFLLQTSILSRMNALLCQRVTQGPTPQASQQMLEELERANLFLVPLDEQRQWYRYHDLFREALHARLQRRQPDLVPMLHQRAARAYEEAGELHEALVHALAASDYAFAIVLMKKAAPHFWLSREGRIVSSWLLALPDSALREHIPLALDAALHFLSAHTLLTGASDRDMVEQMIARVEGLVQNSAEVALLETEAARFARRARLLRLSIEVRALMEAGDQLRSQQFAPEIETFPLDPEERWNLIPLSLTNVLNDSFPENRASLTPRMQEARQRLLAAGNYLPAIRLMLLLGQNYLRTGQLHLVRQECMQALALIEEHAIATSLQGFLFLNLFDVAYAQNQLEEATAWLAQILRIAHDWQQPYLEALGEASAVQLALAQADLPTASQALARMETVVLRQGYTLQVLWEMLIRVDYWLASGNLVQASAWVAQHTFPEEHWTIELREEALRFIRVLLAGQQYAQAIEMLARFRPFLEQSADTQTCVRFLACSLVALHYTGRREDIQPIAVRLLESTAPEAYIRVYLDLGHPMEAALDALLAESETGPLAAYGPFLARVLTCFHQKEPRRAHASAPRLPDQQHLGEPEAVPIAPLTRQERKVLHLLIAGHTYPEMAETLVVSLNTIKSQVSSIYRKLGVRRRAEAIAVVHRKHLRE